MYIHIYILCIYIYFEAVGFSDLSMILVDLWKT